MRINIITHYYPPEVNAPASRIAEHARCWARAGHRVTVITGFPSHPQGRVYSGYRRRLLSRETVEGVEVIRVWTWLSANAGAKRIINYLSFLCSVVLQGWRFPNSDVVVTTSPQFFAGLAGAFFQRRRRPWILEIRDLWPESIVAVGAMRDGWVTRQLFRLEAWAYRKADLVVSVTDSFVPHIAARRGDKPIVVIKNGVDLRKFAAVDAAAARRFRDEHGLADKFVAGYVGTHGMAHGLMTVLKAASLLRDRSDIALLLVGQGSDRDHLMAERSRLALDNVIMLDQLPRDRMPAVISAIDAALVLLIRNDTFKSVIPSKMFEMMALARPIVLGVEGESADLLREADAGVAIPPEDADALAAAIRRLADDRAIARRLGANGAAFVRRRFDREKLAAEMLSAFTDTIDARQ